MRKNHENIKMPWKGDWEKDWKRQEEKVNDEGKYDIYASSNEDTAK